MTQVNTQTNMKKAKKEKVKLLKFPIPKGYQPYAYEFRGKEVYMWVKEWKPLHAIAFKI